ncbi:MAG: YheU family protein [Desulfurivibrio sp.]|nr:YheU family protein [Desulfurivibrio sp.]MBU3936008.1 YheU family protein [Pseudomonadota bacterium]MBU4033224.1 YheU family protein [Pseudomonadota bacterium]MBU4117629.1 YheU family protein [Pseudomonadota bacterium]
MSDKKPVGLHEQGVDVPYERLDPETLRNVIEEFVTRDGADWGDAGGTLEEKVGQVMQQLRSRKIKIVFELNSETANIVVNR